MLVISWRHDTQHNDTQHNDTHHNAQHCYGECPVLLRVKPYMLSVAMLNDVMVSVVMLDVIC
jgi:hypothetical protein